jgi:hypothetical protein
MFAIDAAAYLARAVIFLTVALNKKLRS